MKLKDKFFASAPEETVKKGSILLHPEDKLKNVYYLVRGNVKQYIESEYGEIITIHIFRPGSFFPLMLLLGNIPNRFYFEAVNEVKVKVFTAAKAIDFVKKDNKELFALTTRLAEGLNGLVTRLEHLLCENSESRLISLLLYLSVKYGKPASDGTTIWIPITHQEIAQWIGVERETVSRQMKSFKDRGILRYKKQYITVTDLKALSKNRFTGK